MPTTVKDIEHWLPRSWDDIVGNRQIKEYFQDFIWKVRKEGHTSGFNALITGDSRSGKTSAITFGIQCLACLRLDFETLAPCGVCEHCRTRVHIHGNRDWENFHRLLDDRDVLTPVDLHVSPVNSPELDDCKLDRLLSCLQMDDGNIKVVYLDEILRLHHHLAARLLSPMDKYPVIWLASSAYLPAKAGVRSISSAAREKENILKMFQGRFTFRLQTECPSTSELVSWLANRCKEFGISCDTPEATLRFLAESSFHNPGLALQVLNRAHKKRRPLLTRALVETHVFELKQ